MSQNNSHIAKSTIGDAYVGRSRGSSTRFLESMAPLHLCSGIVFYGMSQATEVLKSAAMAASMPDLTSEWDKEKLRNWMANAKRLGRSDVYQAAFRQLCRVEGQNIEDPLEAEFATVIRALEEALTEESGRTKRLSRTRQKLNRVGVRQTLADLALKTQPSLGFMKLLEFNMADMSSEALILKHRNEFDEGVVAAAERRLAEYDVPIPNAPAPR
jgi:hypothetical protein